VKAYILGSNFGGSLLKIGFVGRGMYMEFSTENRRGTIITSRISEVEEIETM
jgi:hypothetical protein